MNKWVKNDRTSENWGPWILVIISDRRKLPSCVSSGLTGMVSLEIAEFVLGFWKSLCIAVRETWDHRERDCTQSPGLPAPGREPHTPAVTFQQESPCMKSGVGSWRAWWSLSSWPMSLNFFPSRHSVGLDFPVPLEVTLGLATCFGQWYVSNLAPWVSKLRRVCPTDPQWTCRGSKKETSIVLNCWGLSLYVPMAWDSIYWLTQRGKLHDKISRPWT